MNQKSNEGEMYRNEPKEQHKDPDTQFEWLELHETPQHWNWLKN
jgi:N-acetyl-anhydromuramyl-L-alanine amidase AmpD